MSVYIFQVEKIEQEFYNKLILIGVLKRLFFDISSSFLKCKKNVEEITK